MRRSSPSKARRDPYTSRSSSRSSAFSAPLPTLARRSPATSGELRLRPSSRCCAAWKAIRPTRLSSRLLRCLGSLACCLTLAAVSPSTSSAACSTASRAPAPRRTKADRQRPTARAPISGRSGRSSPGVRDDTTSSMTPFARLPGSAIRLPKVPTRPSGDLPRLGTGTWRTISKNCLYGCLPDSAAKPETGPPPPARAHRRKVSELPYHLACCGDVKGLERTLASIEFVEAKCQAGLIYDLEADYARLQADGAGLRPAVITPVVWQGRTGAECPYCRGSSNLPELGRPAGYQAVRCARRACA